MGQTSKSPTAKHFVLLIGIALLQFPCNSSPVKGANRMHFLEMLPSQSENSPKKDGKCLEKAISGFLTGPPVGYFAVFWDCHKRMRLVLVISWRNKHLKGWL